MADYQQAAADLKARIDAKTKRRIDLNAFFERFRTAMAGEVKAANVALEANSAPLINLRQESVGEPTVELACGAALCKISQDRAKPSLQALITGEPAEQTITFIILVAESPVTAQRVSLAPAAEPKLEPSAIAALIVEELIKAAA